VSRPCELCGTTAPAKARYPALQIVECAECGLVYYAGPMPEAGLYGEDYFHGGEYAGYRRDQEILQRNFRRHIGWLLELAPSGKLFEIGCAYGFFLDVARRHWTVKGIDISAEAVRHARETLGLDAAAGDFLDLPDEPGSYDLICMWDTLEHLVHPVRTIEKASRWLKPGGSLVVTTGDVGSLLARARGARWRQIHPPTHLFYFSRPTLGRAFEGAGLSSDRFSWVGYSRSFLSMMYGIFMLGPSPRRRLYRLATLNERLDFPVYLNLNDILLAVGRKPDAAGAGPHTRATSRS
jgi:SAM-dependent methyltransferase